MTGAFANLAPYAPWSGWGMRGWPGYPLHGWGFPLGAVVAALFVAGLVAAVVVLSVRVARRGRGRSSEAMEIVKARYARGEISKNEFEELKKDLS